MSDPARDVTKCPLCASPSSVKDSRSDRRGRWRKRQCDACGHRWGSVEVLEEDAAAVALSLPLVDEAIERLRLMLTEFEALQRALIVGAEVARKLEDVSKRLTAPTTADLSELSKTGLGELTRMPEAVSDLLASSDAQSGYSRNSINIRGFICNRGQYCMAMLTPPRDGERDQHIQCPAQSCGLDKHLQDSRERVRAAELLDDAMLNGGE